MSLFLSFVSSGKISLLSLFVVVMISHARSSMSRTSVSCLPRVSCGFVLQNKVNRLARPPAPNSWFRNNNGRLSRTKQTILFLSSSSPIEEDSSSSSSSAPSSSSLPNSSSTRKKYLDRGLRSLYIDPDDLYEASIRSIQDPTVGYDPNYGKSAIRAYRSFLYPKKKSESILEDGENDEVTKLIAAANRCARQIDFLRKRHQSHKSEWVRHTDNENAFEESITGNNTSATSTTNNRNRFPIILILDNVRSAFNVGSIFRTADACGCQQILTTGITPHPNGGGSDKVAKSALGAEQVVASQHFATTKDALSFLREEYPEWKILGMETTERSIPYTDISYGLYKQKGVVLVLGNEVTGVDTEVLQELDTIVEIPMFGAKNSLNIAACAPVVLYEILRQWCV